MPNGSSTIRASIHLPWHGGACLMSSALKPKAAAPGRISCLLSETHPKTQRFATQRLEQHCALALHGERLCKQEAAWAGVGATMEVTRGKAMAAAMPILRRATRRERRLVDTA